MIGSFALFHRAYQERHCKSCVLTGCYVISLPYVQKSLLIGSNVVMFSKKAVTIGGLIKKDLKEAYFLPQKPSSYYKGYRFLNDEEYQVFDYPPCPLKFRQFVSPFRHLPAAGNEIPIIMECKPESYLQQHWKQWLPAFPPADIKSLNEGLEDEIPVVTTAALQRIPKLKHSVHPDVLYQVQLKSSILNINAPSPRHLSEDAISYPCMVKVGMSSGGLGNRLIENEGQLSTILRQIRDVCHWEGEIVFQEFISGVKEVPSFQFYLHKSGEIFWVGTTTGEFDGSFAWTSGTVDWDKQEEYEQLVYEEFTRPVKNYLHERGYFGLVTFEVLITDHGKYLVDVNPTIGGDTTHLLLARYMALDIGLKHSAIFCYNKHRTTAKKFVEKANAINNKGKGMIIVLSAADMDEECESYLSVFAKTPEDVQTLYQDLKHNF